MRLRVLSPLHIGNGNRLTPIDLYPADNMVHVLDIEKLLNDLQALGVDIEEILSLIKNPPGDHYVWKGYIDEYRLNPRDYTLYSLPVRGRIGRESMQISEFIKTGGKPYVPGSSIKGAVRTAVLYKVLRECADPGTAMNVVSGFSGDLARKIGYSESLIDYYLDYLESESRNRRFDRRKADDLLEAVVFGMEGSRGFPGIRYEPKRDPMRALIVRDSSPIGRKHLAVYRVEVMGNTSSIPVWVETLESGTEAEVEVVFDAELLRLNGKYFNGLLWECLKDRGMPWEVFEDFIWEALEDFYNAIVEYELKNASKFGRNSSSVRAFYNGMRGRKGLLRLGWGSGWVSTTVGLLLIEMGWKWERARRGLGLGRRSGRGGLSRDFPKTRRLADGKPMGWVMLE